MCIWEDRNLLSLGASLADKNNGFDVKPGATGITRVMNAMVYSWQGLKAAWKHEAAFRQEAALAVLLMPLAVYLGNTGVERALLLGVLFLVLIAELLNSAIEAIVDKTSPEHHELAGRAKDMGSAAVMISLACVAAVWAMVLF